MATAVLHCDGDSVNCGVAYHERDQSMSAVALLADIKYWSNSDGKMPVCAAWVGVRGKVRLYPPTVSVFVLSVGRRALAMWACRTDTATTLIYILLYTH